MENNQSPSKKKLISIQEEKLIREFDYDSTTGSSSRSPRKELLLDLEILRKNPTQIQPSQRVLVSIKPRTPAIKTIYIAEKSRFHPKKGSEKSSRSRLGIGDHSSFTTHFSGEDSHLVKPDGCGSQNEHSKSDIDTKDLSSEVEKSATISECSESEIPPAANVNVYNDNKRSAEKCYILTQPPLNMNHPKIEVKAEKSKVGPNKVDIATLVKHEFSSQESIPYTTAVFYKLSQRIEQLERKVLKQEMVFRSLDPDLQRSSDEDCDDANMRSVSGSGRPGCSYIQNYSHIPETSAFQRYAQHSQISQPSQSHATTLEKEHNSEQYGRDFTAYDGITARGRRQCASVPCKRDEFPKGAAERVHKIRHKLNPVRDYRLMDTVHYLAQGEFAPRDDGIKLTPSREAVLSDIIYEDVCRTHWPNTRLGRRTHPERCSTRCELQRLIDSLLRERVQHVERRRRRHYRIVKLNHRHESCRPVGKTGDIIVASHKNKNVNDERDVHISDHNAASAMMARRQWDEETPRRGHYSHDRLTYPEKTKHRSRQDDSSPGTSSAAPRGPGAREPTCCYRTDHSIRMQRRGFTPIKQTTQTATQDQTSSSTITKPLKPRLVVKKDASGSVRRKHGKDEPNLEQYIVLPTLVIRTPSNVRRQKKFNELYHRILNVQLNYDSAKDCAVASEASEPRPKNHNPIKKDIGLNINITLPGSAEDLNKKRKANTDERFKKYDDGNKKQKAKWLTTWPTLDKSVMDKVKNWLCGQTTKKNGLYVHHSPPKLVEATTSQNRHWARIGAHSKLERAVLAGQGRRLLQTAASLPIASQSNLPSLVAKCNALHAAVEKGSLLELQTILESDYNRRKHVTCRDEAGVGLLHKAIYYDFQDIAEYLVANYPQLVHQRDSAGRTPLHYTAVCRDPASIAGLLERAGAERGARDTAGRTAAHYRGAARTRLVLPAVEAMPDPPRNPPGLVIKRHNIRIWCHDCDMARLQRVVWEGHGSRLLTEVSNQPVVKRFLEAVPYIMNTIREIHKAVTDNDLESLIKLAGDPVPPQILSSRDPAYMTVMHKAAGLGHGGIVSWLAERYPDGIHDIDNDGRTPLHYAAAVRDDEHMYNKLVDLGADEGVVDKKNHTPRYYVNRPNEIDRSIFERLPDAPRTISNAYPHSWDWNLLDAVTAVEQNKKPKRKNLRASHENIASKNHSQSVADNINKIADNRREDKREERRGGMKTSSTYHGPINFINHTSNKKQNDNVEDKETDAPKGNENKELKDEEVESKIEDNQEEPEPIKIDNHIEETNKEKEPQNMDLASGDVISDNKIAGQIKTDMESAEEKEKSEEKEKFDEKSDANVENHDKDSSGEVNESDDQQLEEQSNDTVGHGNIENQTNESKPINEKNETEEEIKPEDSQDLKSPVHEGNNDTEYSEDDDDVQVPKDTQSEYSDIHQQSTAEAENPSSAKRGNENDGQNTQENAIEGIVSGEAEQDSQDASITRNDDIVHEDSSMLVVDSEIDPEVAELINTSNMEMLAALVLNGEGSRLVGRRSRNEELQAFLDNVPVYMQKINKVHLAAREGNIKDLQMALDRRKFAIARDPISPNGATPLHVAVVFGKTNIIKYLGGRFPETLSAVDYEGRTALHYAAVLPDNGHYFNLLQQLGANAKDLDDNGQSVEEYHKNPTLLPFHQLISDFGMSEEDAQTMLTDKGTSDADNSHMDIPVFKTDEGRYLAKSLGDPLIKGLTEVANVKPKDPVAFLASFLQNFPNHEKPRLGTQESNVIVTREDAELENEQPPPLRPDGSGVKPSRSAAARTATKPHRPIDVITIDPQQPEVSPDAPEPAFSSVNRDEHGQSMLHFAAARKHTRNALFQLLQESDISIGYRDELYRTARDVSIQANVPENTQEIDRWILHLAARGNAEKLMQMLLEGYDHILDVVDDNGVSLTEVVAQRGSNDMNNLLASIPTFEESRESLHGAIRRGDLSAVQQAIMAEGGKTLARAHNTYGRTTLHVAVLAQNDEIVTYLAQAAPELLRIGDNLERTPLHYAMGVDRMESLSRILIKAGAKRVLKDLKGRQPSYYFMNKSDILRLKEEEDIY